MWWKKIQVLFPITNLQVCQIGSNRSQIKHICRLYKLKELRVLLNLTKPKWNICNLLKSDEQCTTYLKSCRSVYFAPHEVNLISLLAKHVKWHETIPNYPSAIYISFLYSSVADRLIIDFCQYNIIYSSWLSTCTYCWHFL